MKLFNKSVRLQNIASVILAAVVVSLLHVAPANATVPVPTISALTPGQTFAPNVLTNVTFAGQPLTGFTGDVEVRLRVLGGSGLLHVTQVAGMTLLAGYSSAVSANVANLGYSGSQTSANAMLATLQYFGDSTVGSDDIRIDVTNATTYGTLSGDFLYGGHVYQTLLNLGGAISWTDASTAATSLNKAKVGGGTCPGYLVTFNGNGIETSNKGFLESAWFLANIPVTGHTWFGASDQAAEGHWKWVTDPDESVAEFWVGNPGGSAQNGYFNKWLQTQEPNGGTTENYGQFYQASPSLFAPVSDFWNDAAGTDSLASAYAVEYGSSSCQPQIAADNEAVSIVSFVTANAPAPTTPVVVPVARPWTGPTIGAQPSRASRQVLTTGGTLEIVGSGFDTTTSVKLNGVSLSFDAKDPKLIKIQIPAGTGSPNLEFASSQGGVIYQNAFEYVAPKRVLAPQTLNISGRAWTSSSRAAILKKLNAQIGYNTVTCRIVTATSAANFRSLKAFCQTLRSNNVFTVVNIVDARISTASKTSSYRIQFLISE
jgi:hypothetical protein